MAIAVALAESQALKSPDIPVEIDHRISEKSFGIFAGRNLNLLRLALGYEGFEEMLHSHNEAPPAGEKISQVYRNGTVDLEDYVSTYGLVANLNVVSAAASSVGA